MLISESRGTPQFLWAATPLAVLLGIWWIAMVIIRRCSQRRVQQEIEQLSAFEREYEPLDKPR